MGSGSTKHPFASVAISFLSCGNRDKSVLSINRKVVITILTSNPGQDSRLHTLCKYHCVQVGVWQVEFRKNQDELRWKLSMRECPAISRGQLLWYWRSTSAVVQLSFEKQKVCYWLSQKIPCSWEPQCAESIHANYVWSLEHISMSVVIWAITNLHRFLSCLKSWQENRPPISDGKDVSCNFSFCGAESFELQLPVLPSRRCYPGHFMQTRSPSSSPSLLLGMKQLKVCVIPDIVLIPPREGSDGHLPSLSHDSVLCFSFAGNKS